MAKKVRETYTEEELLILLDPNKKKCWFCARYYNGMIDNKISEMIDLLTSDKTLCIICSFPKLDRYFESYVVRGVVSMKQTEELYYNVYKITFRYPNPKFHIRKGYELLRSRGYNYL